MDGEGDRMSEKMKLRSWSEILEEDMISKEIDAKVDPLIFINRMVIKEINLVTAKKLYQFAKQNSEGHWGNAIEMLLNISESHINEYSQDRLEEMEKKVAMLEAMMQQEGEESNKIKTLGGGEIGK